MELLENHPLAGLTTYRIGGAALWFAEVRELAGLESAFAFAGARGVGVFVIGGGSNLLVDDAGFPGLVVKLAGGLAGIEVDAVEDTVIAGGGVRLKKLGRALTGMGYGDFLFMTGIPGTVGGAVAMNAGTREGEVSSVCRWVEVFDPALGLRRMNAKELEFGYRDSILRRRCGLVVVRACFNLGALGDRLEISRRVRNHLLDRAAREPRNRKNCGSVFKAAQDGTPAGMLIDRAGLKGARIGNAMIANEHANWIVNLGGATSRDVKALVNLASEKVRELFGVDLEREVVYLPQDISDRGLSRDLGGA